MIIGKIFIQYSDLSYTTDLDIIDSNITLWFLDKGVAANSTFLVMIFKALTVYLYRPKSHFLSRKKLQINLSRSSERIS